jgi:bacterioferritin (cytochrome b1)
VPVQRCAQFNDSLGDMRKNISIEGRIVRDGVRKTLAQRKSVIEELVKAIKQYRQSQDHQSIHALNKTLERAELLFNA